MQGTTKQPGRGRRAATLVSAILATAVVLGVLAAGLAMPIIGAVGGTTKNVAETLEELPLDLDTKPLAQKTNVLDTDGNLIASFYDENRVSVSLDQIAKPMIQAIVSIEDYRFYEHGAIDLKGTLRALLTNQASAGNVQGGSSITQQMVKLTLVDMAETKEERDKATEDSYERKIRELRYAIAFEQNYSKDWILERYLNIAYFGDGAYGVQAAARHYFNKNASKLTIKEAATLAGLVKNPVGYDPTTYPDRALTRRNIVLNRMAELSVIPAAEAKRLKDKSLGLDVRAAANGCVNSPASFFCDYVYRYLLEDPALGKTPEERRDLMRSGGLTIHTTVDLDAQKAADKSVSSKVFPKDDAIGALAMVEPRTGNVRAIAQSRPMGDNVKKGETYLNYVVNEKYGDSAGFPGGSTFKLFVMATALTQGEVSMRQIIDAPKQKTFDQRSFPDCDGYYGGGAPWTVNNSTTSGPMDMYAATRNSVNTYYVQLEQKTGLCEPFKLARKMGVDLDNPTEGIGAERTPSFVLGAANASPLEMAEAYATFAGRGLHCDSRPVTSIEDSEGKTLKKYPSKCKQVLRGAVADAVNDVLRGVQEPGGFGYQNGIALNQPSAGKTGTSQSNKSVWFVGYTPNLAAAAMIGGANQAGTPIPLAGQTIGGSYWNTASGSGRAGPIWGDAMKAIQGKLKDEDFRRPSGSDVLGVQIRVPSVSGMTVAKAIRTLEKAGFDAREGSRVNSDVKEGLVAWSSPGSGAGLSSGDTVYVYPSTGYVPPKPEKKPAGDGSKKGSDGKKNDDAKKPKKKNDDD